DFIELLDVRVPQRQTIKTSDQQSLRQRLHIEREPGVLKVTNLDSHPLLIHSLQIPGDEELLNVVVDGDETVILHMEPEFQEAKLNLQVARDLDVIVPRTRCLVRHRAEQMPLEMLPD